MNRLAWQDKIKEFFLEDIGERDVTAETIFPEYVKGKGVFVAKADGILSGLDIIEMGYRMLDRNVSVIYHKKDGDKVTFGEVFAEVEGNMASLLTGERVILNMMQRMSGIATITNEAVTLLNDNTIHIVDTRKTIPGLRMFEKYAVTCGGGRNHRFGLHDGVMIKDNHIEFAGSIEKAVNRVRSSIGHMIKIEVEIETKEQLQEAIEQNVDVIMFDNRTPLEIAEWVGLVPNHIITEASGGISLENIATFRGCGVNYISLGMITHSVKALDISFNVSESKVKALQL